MDYVQYSVPIKDRRFAQSTQRAVYSLDDLHQSIQHIVWNVDDLHRIIIIVAVISANRNHLAQ